MTPKIDYVLLGQTLDAYQRCGYTYVEVPWYVSEEAVRATLPKKFLALELAMKEPLLGPDHVLPYCRDSYLVGSAEQGFITMGLEPGAYVGVTPCFRHEPTRNLFYQTSFMKIELFINRIDGSSQSLIERVCSDAREVMSLFTDARIDTVPTNEGVDLEIAGIEVGSYGAREHETYGKWVYGTGLALPRFSVAEALASVV